MFELIEQMLVQLVQALPYFFGLYLLFDFTGSILFNKR